MKQVKTDRRTRKTRKLYEDALITLLKTKDINKVTVTDISEMVDMNRSTFYIHYDDIYDLLESIENNLINELEKFTEVPPVKDRDFMYELSFSKVLRAVEFAGENREIFTVLLNDQGNLMFLTRIKKIFSQKLLSNFLDISDNVSDKYSDVFSSFFISGFIGIIQEWLKNDSGISAFELATIMQMILKTSIDNIV